METNKGSKLNILIIPKTQKVKGIMIPAWLPRAIFISIIVIFIIIILFLNKASSFNSELKKDCNDNVSTIVNLENKINEFKHLNRKKSIKIDKLKVRNEDLSKKMNEVEEKIKHIDELKNQLENMTK